MAAHGEKCIHLYFCSELAVIAALTAFTLRASGFDLGYS